LLELEERGLDALSLRSIAARVGVSHTAPKNHFDGLRGLLTAIATVGFERHAAEMRRGVEDAAPGRARLDAACNGYVRFALENPELFKLMFSSTLCNADDPDLKRAAWASYEVLRGAAHGLDWDKADAPGSPWRHRVDALEHGPRLRDAADRGRRSAATRTARRAAARSAPGSGRAAAMARRRCRRSWTGTPRSA
jgi:AcrR family transcriptional regulator